MGRLAHTTSVADAIDFVFPDDVLCNPEECVQRAILSPYNDHVDEFNEAILTRLPGQQHTYFSSDEIEGAKDGTDTQCEIDAVATPETLNAMKEPGVPPHELTLAVGSVCRLTRNFDVSQGLTKNTRVIIRSLLRHSVQVQTLPQVIAGATVRAVCLNYSCQQFLTSSL